MIFRHILWVFIWMSLSDSISGQSFFSDLEFSLDYSILQQDKRLFTFPGRNAVLKNSENIRHDHEYGILLSKEIFDHERFSLDAGIGYSIYAIQFQRPFNHRYFTDNIGSEEGRYVDRYLNHRITFANEINLKLFGTGAHTLNLATPFNLNISLNKNIRSLPKIVEYKTFSKWRAEFSNLEIYSGLKYKNNYANIGVYFRVFNMQKIDRVIFNSILWGYSPESSPEIKDKKFEMRNWTALQIKLGLILNKSP